MEQGFGSDSVPAPGSVDKSRVLTVRPLRCLVPIFPSPSSSSSPQGGPFMCIPPNGPFPPGISPFYPFSETQRTDEQNPQAPFGVTNQAMHSGFNNAIASPVPINSFRTPDAQAVTNSTHYSGAANGVTGSGRRSTRSRAAGVQSDVAVINEDGYSDSQNQSDQYLSSFSMHVIDAGDNSKSGKRRGNYQKRTRSGADIIASPVVDVDSVANSFLASLSPAVLDALRQTDGDKESVRIILIIFNLLRRRITQIEDGKDTTPGITRRPDLRAGTILMNKGFRANIKKRVGAVPGIEIGDIFFFRMELCLVGLHAPSMAGIDYMTLKVSQDDEPVAVSIVSSGGYEDNVEDGDVLIYSGQGGNIYRKDKDVMFRDQKLERGNLALEKSLRRGNEVRVIRGVKDVAHPTGKVYVYDGLYKIQQSWIEKGKSGINIFKYKLVRLPGTIQKNMHDSTQEETFVKTGHKRRRRRTKGSRNNQQKTQQNQQTQNSDQRSSKQEQPVSSQKQDISLQSPSNVPKSRHHQSNEISKSRQSVEKSKADILERNPQQHIESQSSRSDQTVYFNKRTSQIYHSANLDDTAIPAKATLLESNRKAAVFPRTDNIHWKPNVITAPSQASNFNSNISNVPISRFATYADVIAPHKSAIIATLPRSNTSGLSNGNNITTPVPVASMNNATNHQWYSPFGSGLSIQLTPPASPQNVHRQLPSTSSSVQSQDRNRNVIAPPPSLSASNNMSSFSSSPSSSLSMFTSSSFPSLSNSLSNQDQSKVIASPANSSFRESFFGRKYPVQDQEKGELSDEEDDSKSRNKIMEASELTNQRTQNDGALLVREGKCGEGTKKENVNWRREQESQQQFSLFDKRLSFMYP